MSKKNKKITIKCVFSKDGICKSESGKAKNFGKGLECSGEPKSINKECPYLQKILNFKPIGKKDLR